MLKLTRLNNQVVVVNPDLVYAVDATPDTTLRLVGGERIIVRETLDELITKVVEFRQRVQRGEPGATEADTGGVASLTLRQATDVAAGTSPSRTTGPLLPNAGEAALAALAAVAKGGA